MRGAYILYFSISVVEYGLSGKNGPKKLQTEDYHNGPKMALTQHKLYDGGNHMHTSFPETDAFFGTSLMYVTISPPFFFLQVISPSYNTVIYQ